MSVEKVLWQMRSRSTNKNGLAAVIESLLVPDKNGNLVDVVLGFGVKAL